MSKNFPSIFKTVLIVLACTFAFVPVINAQQTQIGYLGKGKDQYSVFIFGDALAGGLWAGGARISINHAKIKLNGRYSEGSGLARPQFYNWAKKLPVTLESKKVDIAIVLIGINDAQDIRRSGEYLVFNSEPWRETYTQAVATMMSQLTKNKTAVYWVEVPPVKRVEMNDRLKIIAAIHKKQAAKAGIRFVSIRKEFTTTDGSFTLNGAGINGNLTRLRSRNGIRFIKPGNDRLASIVLNQIDRDITIADGDKPVADFPVPDSSNIASKQETQYTGPIFGSASSDNLPIITAPQDMPLAGLGTSSNVLVSLPTFGSKASGKSLAAGLSGASPLEVLKNQVAKNSSANALFEQGIWPAKQTGRADDFSRPAQ